ncbi:MAG TPA: MFS transporter [Gemmatimonadales bacterium]|nr:MFS transporter [Gemmatimonadales bacterium]
MRPVLDRRIGIMAGAVFLMTLGEELWKRFIPKYLESVGAPVLAIGGYGSMRDLLDGLAQYPGGWLADRFGRRAGLLLFISVAVAGYVLMAAATSWGLVLAGLVLAMAWSSMASPALFSVIGDALPPEHRTLGFSVQSILRRVPIVVAPFLGGLLMVRHGVSGAVRLGLVVSVGLSFVTLALVSRLQLQLLRPAKASNIADVWGSLPGSLRRLLFSDILVRACEALADVFLVLYALNIIGITAPEFGVLVGIQMITAILGYLPGARLAQRTGPKPLVVATFLAFALFPIAVVSAHSFGALVPAFVIGGLREIGEPARKALIVDSARPDLRARTVGLYYLIRSLSIAPAATVGGLLWQAKPALPFLAAGAFGALGALVFAARADQA